MKKLLLTLALLNVFSFAQVGIVQSTSGIHVPSAQTLQQGKLYVSGSFEMVSDGLAPSMEGYYTDSEGNQTEINNDAPSNDENFFASFGILDNLEIGLSLPMHYDGDIPGLKTKGFALGDILLLAKGYIPVSEWLHVGVSSEITAPTGSNEKGFRPRHRWYVRRDGSAYALTADHWTFNGNIHLSVDIRDYARFNSYIGILKVLGPNNNYLLWGGGLNFFPETRFIVIFEASGELPLHSNNAEHNFLSSPFRLTPGLRIRLPYESNLTISGDFGLGYFRKKDIDDGLPVTLKTGESEVHYTKAGTPDIGIAISFSKTLDFSWSDDDNDGVIDRKDMCPGTAKGLKVNERGCPVDEDQDGVLNIVDLCSGTPHGIAVDYNGCPLDHDRIPDYLDMCPNTPERFAVDSTGCTRDSDGDGIDDNNDKCDNTPNHEKVGPDGCPRDQDHDGIPNDVDQCPNTPEGISNDRWILTETASPMNSTSARTRFSEKK